MGGSRLTTVNENGRRKTHRPSNETVAAIDGYATHHSVSSSRPVLTRPPLHQVCDELAICVSEILSARFHRHDGVQGEGSQ